MAEIIQRAGTWTFDGDTVRIVPGSGKSVGALRKSLGEVSVPLTAVAGIAYEAGRKGGRLRLRLREGADPLSQVAGGRLPDASDPYQLAVELDRSGVAEYLVDEVRQALLLEQIAEGPCDRYLLPGPAVPLTGAGTDGTATFDGERVQVEWNWITEESKSSGGPRTFPLHDLAGVEWTPAVGWENGSLRFRPKGAHATLKPQHDPNCLTLWGIRQARETGSAVLLATAITARLPHPSGAEAGDGAQERPAAGESPVALTKRGGGDTADHDGLLRRLRELGELHSSGILTDDEFAVAKKAILDRF
ncbi:DUF4429 domain-containing protein [Streptomyces sp. N2-109]|uniref:DUF4429 domain-containing protein n=1 Tax=Streptomyces gossypii TaxID=2883101 RepID=A0ABT2JT68_9ACTN|nr:DUF4429 domain-containing protein [Streptomyces gossypii]MCT2591077.1 DUF4429 domain-containing protein [Streptomyces gossypii]